MPLPSAHAVYLPPPAMGVWPLKAAFEERKARRNRLRKEVARMQEQDAVEEARMQALRAEEGAMFSEVEEAGGRADASRRAAHALQARITRLKESQAHALLQYHDESQRQADLETAIALSIPNRLVLLDDPADTPEAYQPPPRHESAPPAPHEGISPELSPPPGPPPASSGSVAPPPLPVVQQQQQQAEEAWHHPPTHTLPQQHQHQHQPALQGCGASPSPPPSAGCGWGGVPQAQAASFPTSGGAAMAAWPAPSATCGNSSSGSALLPQRAPGSCWGDVPPPQQQQQPYPPGTPDTSRRPPPSPAAANPRAIMTPTRPVEQQQQQQQHHPELAAASAAAAVPTCPVRASPLAPERPDQEGSGAALLQEEMMHALLRLVSVRAEREGVLRELQSLGAAAAGGGGGGVEGLCGGRAVSGDGSLLSAVSPGRGALQGWSRSGGSSAVPPSGDASPETFSDVVGGLWEGCPNTADRVSPTTPLPPSVPPPSGAEFADVFLSSPYQGGQMYGRSNSEVFQSPAETSSALAFSSPSEFIGDGRGGGVFA